MGNPLASSNVTRPTVAPVQQQVQAQPTQPVRPGSQTSGGGRVVPYQDMSDILSKIAGGR